MRYLPLGLLLLFALFPFYWMLLTTLKQDPDLYSLTGVPFWFNAPPTLAHVRFLFSETLFGRWFVNNVFIGVLVSLITIVIATLGGYGLSRFSFAASNAMGVAMFVSYLVPQALLFIPLSRLMAGFGLSNTLWSLVVTYPTLTVPFSIWFMMGYFRNIPRELDEAALVDGCSPIGVLYRIVLPLSFPGILTIGLYSFVLSWQEYLYAVTFISDSKLKTVAIAATNDLVRGDVYFWGPLMAATLVGSLPTILVFSVFAKYFVSGMTRGAIK